MTCRHKWAALCTHMETPGNKVHYLAGLDALPRSTTPSRNIAPSNTQINQSTVDVCRLPHNLLFVVKHILLHSIDANHIAILCIFRASSDAMGTACSSAIDGVASH